MDEKEIKQFAIDEVNALIDMVPKHLHDSTDPLPEDIKQKMKERTLRTIKTIRDA